MASRSFHKLVHAQQGLVKLEGSFAPAGTGAVTSVKGKGFTVARSGVGVFTVTLADKYAELISGWAGVQLNALANTDAQLGAVTVGTSTNTIVINIKTAGVAADISANANNRVHFSFTLRNTAVS